MIADADGSAGPEPLPPTGTVREVPGTTMPFSGFGRISGDRWVVPAASDVVGFLVVARADSRAPTR